MMFMPLTLPAIGGKEISLSWGVAEKSGPGFRVHHNCMSFSSLPWKGLSKTTSWQLLQKLDLFSSYRREKSKIADLYGDSSPLTGGDSLLLPGNRRHEGISPKFTRSDFVGKLMVTTSAHLPSGLL